MSAASPATSQVRRSVSAATRPAASVQRPAAQVTRAPAFAFADVEDEIRINLSDIPRMSLADAMQVEGLKPSLLSRLVDLLRPTR